MSWEKSSYTAAGAALLSESLSGGALVITRAVSGTGTADADLSGETGVSGETHDLKLLDIETVESGGETARRVKIQITGADETYIMHQVGVYGRLNDDAETLLFIMQDARGVEVPSTKVNGDFEIELSALLAVSNKANISITVDPQMQALAKLVKAEIEKHNADASAHAATITAAVSAAVKNLSESGEILNEEQVKALIKEQVDGGTGGGYYGSYKLTLAADEWKPARSEDDYENAGGMDYYQCIYDAELSDSTSELVPVGVVSPGSFYTTTKAGVLNGCETHDGFIRFFAQRIPEADIQATVTLFGKGGGSGETGSVSIGQGLKRDASGAIAVRIGEGLDFDSANALAVRKETVMTSEDLLDEEETQAEIKKTFVKKDAFTPVQAAANAAIKSLGVDGNTVNFYTSTDKSGTAAFSVDFPSELFLDQTKTTFVAKFKFDAATYPGATDPKLDGKPVMVLAVKGENPDSCTYSFLSMAALVDTYKAKAVGKDASTTVTIAGYEVDVKVNVSAAAGNALALKDDGLYVPTPEEVDISGKADKVTGATTGNLAALDGEGNLTDSGKKPADFVAAEAGKRLMTDAEGEKLAGVSEGATKTAASSTNGNVNIDGKEVVVYTEPENVLHDEDVEDFSAEEIAALLAD